MKASIIKERLGSHVNLSALWRDAGLNPDTMRQAVYHERDLRPEEAAGVATALDMLRQDAQELQLQAQEAAKAAE